jgi:preprotein translocase subunit SecB
MSSKTIQTPEQTPPSDFVFSIHNIYLKDVSFESPNAPAIFRTQWQPKVDLDLQMGSQDLGDNLYEVVIHLTLGIKLENEQTAFLIELKQAGIFALQGLTAEQLERALSTTCPEILFPYAREAISNLAMRGGFPQLALPPINFEAMYLQHISQKEAGGTEGEGKGEKTKGKAETVVH